MDKKFTRRDILKVLGAIPFVGCVLYLPDSATRYENNFPWLESDEDFHGHSSQWHKENTLNIDNITEEELSRLKSYAPLKTAIASMTDIDDRFLAEAERRLRRDWGLNPSAIVQYRRISTRQLLVPAPEKVGESLKKYCKRAVEFLHENVKGLQTPEITWETVPLDYRVSQPNLQNKGIVGHSHYTAYLIEIGTCVRSRDGSVRMEYRSYEMFDFKRSSFMEYLHKPSAYPIYHVFIGSCMPVIREPFSEIIPFTTIHAGEDYGKRYGQLARAIACETLDEAVSYYLGLAIADKLKIPDGRKLVEESIKIYEKQARLSIGRYVNVPKAIAYIAEKGGFPHGVQMAFNIGMDNMERFMKEIGAT